MVTTRQQRPPTAVERGLRINQGERALVGWLVTLFAVTQSSHGLGANAADALFFQRFGVEQLPLMILLSGLAVMIAILGHGAGLAYRGTHRWLPFVTIVFAGWATVEWAGAIWDTPAAYPVIWISTQVIMMASLTVMWNAAGASCTTRQAKRLFPIFATAGVAGGVIGNLLTGPLANLLGTANLLLVQAGLLLCAALLLVRCRPLFSDDDETPPTARRGLSETITIVRSSKFLTVTAVFAVALFCLFYLVYFPFSESVATSFDTEAETAAFLGVFSSIATAATFVFSLLATNRLFSRLGVVVTLVIVPVVYAGGFATWLMTFTLPTAAVVRGMQWVAVNAIALTAYNALFNVVRPRRRGQVNAFMTAVPAQIGVSLAGLLLVVAAAWPIQAVFGVGLAVSLITLGLVFMLRKRYLSAVVSAVRRGVIGLFDSPSHDVFTPMDADSVRILREYLTDARPRARAMAVAGLGRLGQSHDAADIEPLLGDSDPRVRSAAFESVCSIEPDRVSGHAAAALRDEVPEVRLQAIHYLAARLDGHEVDIAPAMDDDDVGVRAAASAIVGGPHGERTASELLATNDARAVTAVLTETSRETSALTIDATPYLDHDDSNVRTAAATVFAASGGDPHLLRPGLDDASPRVRAASANGLATHPGGTTVLIDVLATGSVNATEAALGALTPIEEFMDDFVGWAKDEAERAAYLMSCADAIETAEPSSARTYLLRVLEMRCQRLVQWVLVAMTTDQTRDVMPLVARGVRSGDPEIQSQAIEALETIGVRDVLDVLLPLLESGREDTKKENEALTSLTGDFDPWLAALAARVLDGDGFVQSLSPVRPDETQQFLDTMDRVLVLQGVRMFSDLDPEDLDLIARNTSETTFEPGELVFRAGDSGIEMIVIVEGSVIVTVDEDAGRRLIKEYGPGEHVGELSLLTGGVRSADVHAGEDGVAALSLSKSNLLAVLEERPQVAVGMLGTLASRLIEQT